MQNSPTPRNGFCRYPLFMLSVYFACGILIARLFDVTPVHIGAAALVITGLSLVRRSAAAFLVPLMFAPLGAFCFFIENHGVADDRVRRIYADARIASYEPVELEGTLIGYPEPASGGAFLRIRVRQISFQRGEHTTSGAVRLFVAVEDEIAATELARLQLRHGSRVLVMCRLEREERFQNPGTASRIEILDQQGIDATATLKSPRLIEKLGEDPVLLPLAWVYERRQHLIRSFREHLSPQAAGVMIASLLGDKHFLDRETAEVFRDGGTFHVLVISGLHITFIGGVSLWFISLFTKRRSWQAALTASFLWAYTFAVGAEIPVVRASLMFTVLLLGSALYRTGSLLNALGACTLLLLCWRPSDLFAPSFQLTYVSVVAIVGCSVPIIEKLRSIGAWMPSAATPLPPVVPLRVRRLCEMFYWNEAEWKIENSRHIWSANLLKRPYLARYAGTGLQRIAAWAFEGLVVSAIVQLWMLPLSVVYFHRVSPASIFLNLWVGLFIALESFAAVAALALNAISAWLAKPLFLLTEAMNSAMLSVPAWLSAIDVAGTRVPIYSGFYRAVYPIFLLAVVTCSVALFRWSPFEVFEKRFRLTVFISASCAILLAAVTVLHPFSEPTANGKLTIDFLDVGQGDSIFIAFPNGDTMLVDGGGRPSFSDASDSEFEADVPRIGEAVVSEFLWEKGYSRVDHLIATHADADHLQGLVDIARNFEIGSALVGAEPYADRNFDDFRAALRSQGVQLKKVGRGHSMAIGGVQLTVHHPTEVDRSSNNNSIVISLSFGSHSVLLTGDIERQAEEDLVETRSASLRSSIVKVPHHGSRTSSTDDFVAATRPAAAIISVGRRSRFGHPHKEVVDRWRNAGADVITTGERGTVTVTSDGTILTITRFRD